MIASLHGKVESLGSEWAVINVGGIGFQVYMPTSSPIVLSVLRVEVKLYTHLYLKEDNATLYGFASADELGLFQTLISVSGLGPKLALAMLSSVTVRPRLFSKASYPGWTPMRFVQLASKKRRRMNS